MRGSTVRVLLAALVVLGLLALVTIAATGSTSGGSDESRRAPYFLFDTAVGLFQVRQLTPDFMSAEWGFALGLPFWGTGLFRESAEQVIAFAFETMGVHRLEARAAVANGRGNGALAKIGAVREGVLRKSFLRSGQYFDQAIWSIVREEWRQAKTVWGSKLH